MWLYEAALRGMAVCHCATLYSSDARLGEAVCLFVKRYSTASINKV